MFAKSGIPLMNSMLNDAIITDRRYYICQVLHHTTICKPERWTLYTLSRIPIVRNKFVEEATDIHIRLYQQCSSPCMQSPFPFCRSWWDSAAPRQRPVSFNRTNKLFSGFERTWASWNNSPWRLPQSLRQVAFQLSRRRFSRSSWTVRCPQRARHQ